MPLTAFQEEVLRTIASNRNPDSFFAGGTVVNRQGPRFSEDFDIFQPRSDALSKAIDEDILAIGRAGFDLSWIIRSPTFSRAVVQHGDRSVRLDWGIDSDFRFFPVVTDPAFGWRLHDVDVATAKVLAAAGRQEVRDAIDLLHIDSSIMPLPAAVWAAAGKDPGLTPRLILNELRRNSNWQDYELAEIPTAQPLSAAELNNRLRDRLAAAEVAVRAVPVEDVGLLFLDAQGRPTLPTGDPEHDRVLTRHQGSRGGHWPTNSAVLAAMLERDR